jgi:predicted Co/Zn/Cd cation transporter (cation efflux family)
MKLSKIDVTPVIEAHNENATKLKNIMPIGSYWVRRDPNHDFLYKKVHFITDYESDSKKIVIDGISKSVTEILREYEEGRWVEVLVTVKPVS